jgi:hypothetical protein
VQAAKKLKAGEGKALRPANREEDQKGWRQQAVREHFS